MLITAFLTEKLTELALFGWLHLIYIFFCYEICVSLKGDNVPALYRNFILHILCLHVHFVYESFFIIVIIILIFFFLFCLNWNNHSFTDVITSFCTDWLWIIFFTDLCLFMSFLLLFIVNALFCSSWLINKSYLKY